MITRVKEEDGGFRVAISTAESVIDERFTNDVAQAFAWQNYAQVNGSFPAPPVPPAASPFALSFPLWPG